MLFSNKEDGINFIFFLLGLNLVQQTRSYGTLVKVSTSFMTYFSTLNFTILNKHRCLFFFNNEHSLQGIDSERKQFAKLKTWEKFETIKKD